MTNAGQAFLTLEKSWDRQRLKRQKSDYGFICLHCRGFVPSNMPNPGVHNRNHCPYCLWSRHLDLRKPGDRLAACKALMQPIGLTMKNRSKKYAPPRSGELMLIHVCTGCGMTSINRIAADDDSATIVEIYEQSLGANWQGTDIRMLGSQERPVIETGLFGSSTGLFVQDDGYT